MVEKSRLEKKTETELTFFSCEERHRIEGTANKRSSSSRFARVLVRVLRPRSFPMEDVALHLPETGIDEAGSLALAQFLQEVVHSKMVKTESEYQKRVSMCAYLIEKVVPQMCPGSLSTRTFGNIPLYPFPPTFSVPLLSPFSFRFLFPPLFFLVPPFASSCSFLYVFRLPSPFSPFFLLSQGFSVVTFCQQSTPVGRIRKILIMSLTSNCWASEIFSGTKCRWKVISQQSMKNSRKTETNASRV